MSPCTGNCSLNTTTNICEGCGRSINEIVEWTRMTDEEKQQVMDRLSENQTLSSNLNDTSSSPKSSWEMMFECSWEVESQTAHYFHFVSLDFGLRYLMFSQNIN